MKKCKNCEKTLAVAEFYKNNNIKDGLFAVCKTCVAVRQRNQDIEKRKKTEALVLIKKEIFKEFQENYLVSTYGRAYVKEHYAKNGTFIRGKFLKLTKLSTGYPSITHGLIKYTIHRLVAILFIDNPKNFSHVNHKDGSRDNNHVDNLEWCTHSHNVMHGVKMGRYAKKLTEQDVASIRESKNSIKCLARKYNVSKTNISLILNNKIWKHTLTNGIEISKQTKEAL